MEILIKNIGNLSKECNECLRTYIAMNDGDENLIGSLRVDCKAGSVDCPLAGLSSHGDLIDRMELAMNVAKAQEDLKGKDIDPFMLLGDVLRWIALAPAVLEANNAD